jgi:hypothetical protein
MCDEPTDWAERLERLKGRIADELRSCPDDLLAQLRVCARYFNEGEQEGFDHGFLIDILGISARSVLHLARYSDEASGRVMAALPLLENLADGTCVAPAALPPPPPPSHIVVQQESPLEDRGRKKA